LTTSIPAASALLILGLLAPCLSAAGSGELRFDDRPDRVVLGNARLTMALGKVQKGAVVSLVETGAGRELIADQTAPSLFTLAFYERNKLAGPRLYVASAQAERVRLEPRSEGDSVVTQLEFENVGGRQINVSCTATLRRADPVVRWRFSAVVPETLVLEAAVFPQLVLRAPLSADHPEDAVVTGATKGGIYQRVQDWKPNTHLSFTQPGSLAAQFGCYYDAASGVYTACEDATGRPKVLDVLRTAEGLLIQWQHQCFDSGRFDLEYAVATTTFATSEPSRLTDWRDAADLYKQWAVRQPWCALTFAERPDVPAWMKSGPAMVRFNRAWLADPPRIETWLEQYWRKSFPSAVPLITAYWGWEKVDTWVTPDYFPVFPSDEAFAQLVNRTRALGCHAFTWPSGYHYTLTYKARDDGTFEWDDRERFQQVAEPHAIHNRDGKLLRRKASWLRGGENACLCPGDPWTIDWFNQLAGQLVKRGAEIVQVDQVVGGAFPSCYSTTHGHPPGPGPWMTEVFHKQLRTMLAECRKVNPEAVVCFEEPNELFLQEAALQDCRDWEVLRRQPSAEPASVFNYLYHEYLPTFQSTPRAGDKLMSADCLVNGQLPHFVPSKFLGPGPLLRNGDFEEWTDGVPTGWDKVPGYQGAVWNGRCFRDDAERPGGGASLRLQNDKDEDGVQVSQNVALCDSFAAGGAYRLSVWMKVAELAKRNSLALAALTTDLQSKGGWSISLPAKSAEWTRGEVNFTLPKGADFLRIMLHVNGKCRLWLDEVTLEAIRPDGPAVPVMRPEVPPDHVLMKQWVELFAGEGRPYLLLGKMLHPPRLETPGIQQSGHQFPAILHNAYCAPDGSEAVVAVNATDAPQTGTLTWHAKTATVRLAPWGVKLLRE